MFISFSPGQSMGENGEHPRVVIPRSSSQGKPVDQTSIITEECICKPEDLNSNLEGVIFVNCLQSLFFDKSDHHQKHI